MVSFIHNGCEITVWMGVWLQNQKQKIQSNIFKITKSFLHFEEGLFGMESIELSYKLSLTCGGNINYYKNVHHPIPTHGNREHPGNFQNKSLSSAFN